MIPPNSRYSFYISGVDAVIGSIQNLTDQEKCSLEKYIKGLIERYGVQTDCLDKIGTQDFKNSFIQFIDQIILTCPQEDKIRYYSLKDLRDTVEKMSENQVEDSLLQVLTNHNKISSHVKKIINLRDALQADDDFTDIQWSPGWIEKVEKCSEFSVDFFASFENEPLASETLFCLQYGIVRKEWLKISNIFRKTMSFCSSHTKDSAASETPKWPLNQKPLFSCNRTFKSPPHESVAFMACNWGSGHKNAAQNAAEILEKEGLLPISVDIADELLKDYHYFDFGIYKARKTDGFNFLLQNKAFSLINLMRGEDKAVVPQEDEVLKTLRRLLLINPSMVIESISSLGEPVIAAAQILGIPVMHITTDIDRSCPVRSGPPDYSYFRASIPFDEQYMVPTRSTRETDEQIAVLGPPVKPSYDIDVTREMVATYKEEINSKLGIDIGDKKLVIITNGSFGAFSPYPKMIADLYAGQENIDFVCVVLCGRGNVRFAAHVEAQADRLNRELIKNNQMPCMYAIEFVEPQDMHKLLTISSYGGGVIGKAGGMTTFEICKSKTRAIFDDIPPELSFSGNIVGDLLGMVNVFFHRVYGYENIMPWEKHNQNFAIQAGFASVVRNPDDFEGVFSAMLEKSEPENSVPVNKFSVELPKIVDELTQKARAEPSLKLRRRYNDAPEESLKII